MLETDFHYLEPVVLRFDADSPESFDRSLRSQLRESLLLFEKIKKAVYVIRMKGSFIIAYEAGNSPVLYVGSGNARGRIYRHIGNWITHVNNFGRDVQVEVRILLPRRQRREKFYKNVEADLLRDFKTRYGCLPYFNARLEGGFAGKVNYSPVQIKRMRALIGIGSGNRPWWAIRPTPANPTLTKYMKGTPSI